MANNEAVLEHLREVRTALGDAINTVVAYQRYGPRLTSANQAVELATITTVPSTRQHASDCGICTAWDGTARG